jgi:hypothetical protein
MQVGHRRREIRLRQDDRDVPPRGGLRNHAQRETRHRANDTGGQCRVGRQAIADDRQDRHLLFDRDFRELEQFGDNLGTAPVVVYRNGDADFRRRHHIHSRFVPLEGLEDARRNPCAISIRVEVMSITVMRALQASAAKGPIPGGWDRR